MYECMYVLLTGIEAAAEMDEKQEKEKKTTEINEISISRGRARLP